MRSADRAFGVLVLLALGSGALLVALLATLLPRGIALVTGADADTANVVAVLVLVLATFGVALALISLFRQLLATLSLIRTLLSARGTMSTRPGSRPRRWAASSLSRASCSGARPPRWGWGSACSARWARCRSLGAASLSSSGAGPCRSRGPPRRPRSPAAPWSPPRSSRSPTG